MLGGRLDACPTQFARDGRQRGPARPVARLRITGQAQTVGGAAAQCRAGQRPLVVFAVAIGHLHGPPDAERVFIAVGLGGVGRRGRRQRQSTRHQGRHRRHPAGARQEGAHGRKNGKRWRGHGTGLRRRRETRWRVPMLRPPFRFVFPAYALVPTRRPASQGKMGT
ncbi:hypothetical protein D3C85_1219150 [compost metagenome]